LGGKGKSVMLIKIIKLTLEFEEVLEGHASIKDGPSRP